jgi:hypothetical protein
MWARPRAQQALEHAPCVLLVPRQQRPDRPRRRAACVQQDTRATGVAAVHAVWARSRARRGLQHALRVLLGRQQEGVERVWCQRVDAMLGTQRVGMGWSVYNVGPACSRAVWGRERVSYVPLG